MGDNSQYTLVITISQLTVIKFYKHINLFNAFLVEQWKESLSGTKPNKLSQTFHLRIKRIRQI